MTFNLENTLSPMPVSSLHRMKVLPFTRMDASAMASDVVTICSVVPVYGFSAHLLEVTEDFLWEGFTPLRVGTLSLLLNPS